MPVTGVQMKVAPVHIPELSAAFGEIIGRYKPDTRFSLVSDLIHTQVAETIDLVPSASMTERGRLVLAELLASRAKQGGWTAKRDVVRHKFSTPAIYADVVGEFCRRGPRIDADTYARTFKDLASSRHADDHARTRLFASALKVANTPELFSLLNSITRGVPTELLTKAVLTARAKGFKCDGVNDELASRVDAPSHVVRYIATVGRVPALMNILRRNDVSQATVRISSERLANKVGLTETMRRALVRERLTAIVEPDDSRMPESTAVAHIPLAWRDFLIRISSPTLLAQFATQESLGRPYALTHINTPQAVQVEAISQGGEKLANWVCSAIDIDATLLDKAIAAASREGLERVANRVDVTDAQLSVVAKALSRRKELNTERKRAILSNANVGRDLVMSLITPAFVAQAARPSSVLAAEYFEQVQAEMAVSRNRAHYAEEATRLVENLSLKSYGGAYAVTDAQRLFRYFDEGDRERVGAALRGNPRAVAEALAAGDHEAALRSAPERYAFIAGLGLLDKRVWRFATASPFRRSAAWLACQPDAPASEFQHLAAEAVDTTIEMGRKLAATVQYPNDESNMRWQQLPNKSDLPFKDTDARRLTRSMTAGGLTGTLISSPRQLRALALRMGNCLAVYESSLSYGHSIAVAFEDPTQSDVHVAMWDTRHVHETQQLTLRHLESKYEQHTYPPELKRELRRLVTEINRNLRDGVVEPVVTADKISLPTSARSGQVNLSLGA